MARSRLSIVRSFLFEEDALTATEYAIMLSLVVVVVFSAFPSAGLYLRSAFGRVFPDGSLRDVAVLSRASLDSVS